jgi:hypothetical protein
MGTTSVFYGKPFGYRNRPGTCRWCGDPLRREEPEYERGGYRANGLFCSLRCGYQWAVRRIPRDV